MLKFKESQAGKEKYKPKLSKSHHQRGITKSLERTKANQAIEKQLKKENNSNFIIIENKDGSKKRVSVKDYKKTLRESLNLVKKNNIKNNSKKLRA